MEGEAFAAHFLFYCGRVCVKLIIIKAEGIDGWKMIN
jgi:hypothetical protein